MLMLSNILQWEIIPLLSWISAAPAIQKYNINTHNYEAAIINSELLPPPYAEIWSLLKYWQRKLLIAL